MKYPLHTGRSAVVAVATAGILSMCASPNSGDSGPSAESLALARDVDHGVHAGTALTPLSLDCSDGRKRMVGDPNASHVVTLATSGDCAQCNRHWQGITALFERNAARGHQYAIVNAPPSHTAEATAHMRGYSDIPVCFDTAGVLWSNHNVSHTPVTLVVQNGRVVYVNGEALDHAAGLNAFRREISARLPLPMR